MYLVSLVGTVGGESLAVCVLPLNTNHLIQDCLKRGRDRGAERIQRERERGGELVAIKLIVQKFIPVEESGGWKRGNVCNVLSLTHFQSSISR